MQAMTVSMVMLFGLINKDIDMIMKDFITATERLNPEIHGLTEYSNHECCGCGQTAIEISICDGWTDNDFDNNSRSTVEGNWYCHTDCFRDSR